MLVKILHHGCRFSENISLFQLRDYVNLPFLQEDPNTISKDLGHDFETGIVREVEFISSLFCSPLGQVEKHAGDGSHDGWRKITYLSHLGLSVNDAITEKEGTLQLLTLDKFYNSVVLAGKHYVIMKKNIKSVFRNIPIALLFQWLLGFTW